MKVLKFGATWCPSCLIMRPLWTTIESERPNLKTEYYDYDENTEEVNKWDIGEVLPVAIILDDAGNEITRIVGEKSKKYILEIIDGNN